MIFKAPHPVAARAPCAAKPDPAPRWLWIISFAFLSLALVSPLHAQSSDPARQQFLFAYKLLQKGDNQLAGDAFDDYLGKFPDAKRIGDAKYYRALLYRRAGQNEQAAKQLEHVPKPTLVPPYAVNLLRGQVLHNLGRDEAAVAALRKIDIKSLKPEVGVAVLYLRGLAQRGAKNPGAAATDLKQAAQFDTPMKGRALLNLARVQVRLKHPQDALATLKQATATRKQPVAPEAARMAGDVNYNRGDYNQALTAYRTVLEQYPGSSSFGPAVIGTLWSHYSAKQYQAVLDSFDKYKAALQVQDRVPAFYLAGSAQQKLGQPEKAIALLEQIVHGEGRYPLLEKVLYKLAASRFALGRYDAMRKTIRRLSTRFPKSDMVIEGVFLLASADARQGDVAKGAARLTRIIDKGPTNPYYLRALLHRGRLYETHQKPKPAAEDYTTYLSKSSYRKIGRRPDGKPLYAPSDVQAHVFLRLLDVYQRLDAFGYEAGMAQQWLATTKLKPVVRQEALYRRAVALIQLKQPSEALATFDQLHTRFPANPFNHEATYYRGLLRLSLNQPERAVPLLQQAAGAKTLKKTLRINALRLLAVQQRQTDQPSAAAKTLDQLESLAGRQGLTNAELLWRSRHQLGKGDAKAALAYAAPLVRGRPHAKPRTRSEAVYLAGRAQHKLGRYDAAAKLFEQVVAMGHGYELKARLDLGRVYQDQGAYARALAELSGLINAESTSVAARAIYHSARIQRQLASRARKAGETRKRNAADKKARRLFKRLVLLYPFKQLEPLPQLAHLQLAEIDAELKDFDKSAAELHELIEKYPHGPYATYARAVLAADDHNPGKATALLDTLKKDNNQPDPRLTERIASLRKILRSR